MAQRGRPRKIAESSQPIKAYLDKVSSEVSSNQSRLSMVLGALILLVVGILIFNYFNKGKPSLGPSQQTEQQLEEQDVSPDKLPGKYKVKEGDTLFTIAEKYYQDGWKFTEIASVNNLTNVNLIEVDQVLQIPKFTEVAPSPSPPPTPAESPTTTPTPSPQPDPPNMVDDTTWGPKITDTTYTVQEGDWLSKIAGRAYGDIFAYQKLAQVNNIPNPDLIFPGQVLTIPR